MLIPVHCVNPNHYHHFHHHHDALSVTVNPAVYATTAASASCVICHLSSSMFHVHPSRWDFLLVNIIKVNKGKTKHFLSINTIYTRCLLTKGLLIPNLHGSLDTNSIRPDISFYTTSITLKTNYSFYWVLKILIVIFSVPISWHLASLFSVFKY